jgi:hypothetical protein
MSTEERHFGRLFLDATCLILAFAFGEHCRQCQLGRPRKVAECKWFRSAHIQNVGLQLRNGLKESHCHQQTTAQTEVMETSTPSGELSFNLSVT